MSNVGLTRAPARRWLPRFSIRLLLVVTALVGGILALRQRSTSQHAAAERLTAAGVHLGFNDPVPRQPVWARWLFGDNRYDSVNTLAIVDCTLSPTDARRMRVFHNVDMVNFRNAATRGVIEQIASLPKLDAVYFQDCAVAQEDFQHLRESVQLQTLVLQSTKLDRIDPSILRELPRLKYLSLRGADVNDGLLRGVATLEQLTNLWIQDAQVSAEAVGTVARLPKLQYFGVEDTPITGEWLPGLAESRIQYLSCQGTAIDSSAIDNLILMRKLETVDLRSTRVTKEDVLRLKTARPEMEFRSDYRGLNLQLAPARGTGE
jgi:hypothetical protein